jgi:CSLREA domain-containing protein
MSRYFRYPIVLIVLLTLGAAAWPAGAVPASPSSGSQPFPKLGHGPQAVFTVDSSSDDSNAQDKNPGDGLCQSWLDECTLRAAIEEANAWPGADTIGFDHAMSIYLDSSMANLPTVTEQLAIDASSVWDTGNDQPGVMLHGSGSQGYGLILAADSCQVYGLYITAFACCGAVIVSAQNVVGGTGNGQRNVISGNLFGVCMAYNTARDNVIQGNWIGLSVSGDTANPNAYGVAISDGASNNTVGGDTAAEGNVVSGNIGDGVLIYPGFGSAPVGNRIGGNIIGLAADGISPVPNGQGVTLSPGASQTTIGSPLAPNIIASNTDWGVLAYQSNDNTIQDNTIRDNGQEGVQLRDSAANRVVVNTISGNGSHGVLVTGTLALGNDVTSNSIYDNAGRGIALGNGGNGELPAPTILSATPTGASGTACAGCMVQIYSDSDGEGEYCHGSTTADGSGNWTWSGTILGPNATALNCDGQLNTSEFSAPVPVETPCTPLSGVTIEGPTTGDVGVAVCFTATVSPGDASTPIDYLWDPVPDGQGNEYVCYTWMNPGTYVITVTASNCSGAGTAQDTYTVTIGGGCIPVTGVTISGPITGLVGVPYTFDAGVEPANASAPITYDWYPTPGSGQGSASATYTWATPGFYMIYLAASNCGGGTVVATDHGINISAGTVYRVYLPTIARHSTP